MKIKLIEKIRLLNAEYKISYDESSGGGRFNIEKGEIEIGTKYIEDDPMYTLGVISHEVMELILDLMGGRCLNGRMESNYLFNFDHQTFENAIQIHTQILSEFIA